MPSRGHSRYLQHRLGKALRTRSWVRNEGKGCFRPLQRSETGRIEPHAIDLADPASLRIPVRAQCFDNTTLLNAGPRTTLDESTCRSERPPGIAYVSGVSQSEPQPTARAVMPPGLI